MMNANICLDVDSEFNGLTAGSCFGIKQMKLSKMLRIWQYCVVTKFHIRIMLCFDALLSLTPLTHTHTDAHVRAHTLKAFLINLSPSPLLGLLPYFRTTTTTTTVSAISPCQLWDTTRWCSSASEACNLLKTLSGCSPDPVSPSTLIQKGRC